MNDSIDLIKSMTTELLAFANESPNSPIAICPTTKIQDLLPLLNQLVGKTVSIHFQLSPSDGICLADSVGFERTIVNLVKNENDALPRGGIIMITSSVVEFSLGMAPENVSQIDEGALCSLITVSDSGPGIPKELLGNVFEPFVSKKFHPGQQGLGLGLAICSDIISKAGGIVLAENNIASGAKFKIILPIQPD